MRDKAAGPQILDGLKTRPAQSCMPKGSFPPGWPRPWAGSA